MSTMTLEERVAILETEIAELKRQLCGSQDTKRWLERISGPMKNIPQVEWDELQRLPREASDEHDRKSELNRVS